MILAMVIPWFFWSFCISDFSYYIKRYHGTTMFLEMYHSRTIIFLGVTLPCKYYGLLHGTIKGYLFFVRVVTYSQEYHGIDIFISTFPDHEITMILSLSLN